MSAQRSFAYRWLPDDTEESVVGADWRQEAITNLWSGLRDVARGQGWPWLACGQSTNARRLASRRDALAADPRHHGASSGGTGTAW